MVCLNDKWDAGEQSTKGEERNHGGEVGPRPEVQWPAEDLSLGSVGEDFKQEYVYGHVEWFGSSKRGTEASYLKNKIHI